MQQNCWNWGVQFRQHRSEGPAWAGPCAWAMCFPRLTWKKERSYIFGDTFIQPYMLGVGSFFSGWPIQSFLVEDRCTACSQVQFFTSDQPGKYCVQSWAFPDSRNAKLWFLQRVSAKLWFLQRVSLYGLCSKCQANYNSWKVDRFWSDVLGKKSLMFWTRNIDINQGILISITTALSPVMWFFFVGNKWFMAWKTLNF